MVAWDFSKDGTQAEYDEAKYKEMFNSMELERLRNPPPTLNRKQRRALKKAETK